MTDPSIPTSRNRGHIRTVIKPGALQTEQNEKKFSQAESL